MRVAFLFPRLASKAMALQFRLYCSALQGVTHGEPLHEEPRRQCVSGAAADVLDELRQLSDEPEGDGAEANEEGQEVPAGVHAVLEPMLDPCNGARLAGEGCADGADVHGAAARQWRKGREAKWDTRR